MVALEREREVVSVAIARWDPVRDLLQLQNDLARTFGQAFGAGSLDVAQRMWAPACDVWEREDAFVLAFELPGVDAGGVELTMEDGTLTLRGERRFYDKVEEESCRRVERRFGTFQRSVQLPGLLDPDKIEATYRDGVLTVTVPKAEAAKPKRIAINATA